MGFSELAKNSIERRNLGTRMKFEEGLVLGR